MENKSDEFWMGIALKQAYLAVAHEDVPVGAVIVDGNNELVTAGHNQREAWLDPTAHAEVVVLRDAAKIRSSWRLVDCTLYVTLEPCFMCAGAILQSRIKRVVFGAADPKGGAVLSLAQLLNDNRLTHQCEVHSQILEHDCGQVLRNFFKAKRKAQC